LIPADVYKAGLARLVKERTGRELRIDGVIRFFILPRIELIAERVSLSAPPGGFTADLVQTESLVLGIKLASLLHGSIEIDRVSLQNPKLAFEVDKEGRRNWIFHRPLKSSSTPAVPTRSRDVRLTGVRATVSGGTARYLDQRNGKSVGLNDIDMTVSVPSLAGPLDAKGFATWEGEKVSFEGLLASIGTLRDGGNTRASLKIASDRLKLSFEGELSGGEPRMAAGAVRLEIPSAPQLFDRLGLHSAALEGVLGPLSIKGELRLAGSEISLSEADIALDKTAARGFLTLNFHERPALFGELDVSNLNLSAYLRPRPRPSWSGPSRPVEASAPPPTASDQGASAQHPAAAPPVPGAPAFAPAAGSLAPGSPIPLAQPIWSEARFDLAALRKLDAALKLNVNALHWEDFHVDKATAGLSLSRGRLQIRLPDVALYGGTGSGEVRVDAGAGVPSVAVRADLHRVTVQPMLRDLTDIGQLTGSGDIGIAVTGEGAHPNELFESLAGIASINIANGAVGSAGLAGFLKDIAGPLANRKNLPKMLDFASLTATGTISAGKLYNQDLKLSSPKMSVIGEGMIDLSRRRLDYITELRIPHIAARVAITGPWDDPTYKTQSVTIAPDAIPDHGKLRDWFRRVQ
jgi:AsmA protein